MAARTLPSIFCPKPRTIKRGERGAEERLAPILMTALATGLALVPIVLGGRRAGYEIEHPLAVVILGGLVTSTVLDLFSVPPLYLKYGRRAVSEADGSV